MSRRDLSHLSDRVLLEALHTLVARDRATTADLIAHLAEVDARKLYLPAAYPSMYAYCVGELRLSADSAFKRIRVARAAREFPALLESIASGGLGLTAVLMLAPHLTPENVCESIREAEFKPKPELEAWLAQRSCAQALASPAPEQFHSDTLELAPGRVDGSTEQLAPERVDESPLAPGDTSRLALERVALHVLLARSTHDKLRYAQALLGHAVPDGDLSETLDRALDALIVNLEKRRFAATDRSAHSVRRAVKAARPSSDPRHIPAHIRREVWQRDGGRCTFTSEVGHRCPAESRLEFDHVRPIARGGVSTADNLRLRCRAHNQFDAEQTFGAGFMQAKRDEAGTRRAPRAANRLAPEQEEVMPFLRKLGFRPAEARYGAEACEHLTQQSLEMRVRHAISTLAPPRARRAEPAGAA